MFENAKEPTAAAASGLSDATLGRPKSGGPADFRKTHHQERDNPSQMGQPALYSTPWQGPNLGPTDGLLPLCGHGDHPQKRAGPNVEHASLPGSTSAGKETVMISVTAIMMAVMVQQPAVTGVFRDSTDLEPVDGSLPPARPGRMRRSPGYLPNEYEKLTTGRQHHPSPSARAPKTATSALKRSPMTRIPPERTTPTASGST